MISLLLLDVTLVKDKRYLHAWALFRYHLARQIQALLVDHPKRHVQHFIVFCFDQRFSGSWLLLLGLARRSSARCDVVSAPGGVDGDALGAISEHLRDHRERVASQTHETSSQSGTAPD